VNARVRKKLARRKRRIQKRLDKSDLRGCSKPMFTASNLHYEIGDRGRGISYGGIGAMHLLVRKLGLAEAIDSRLHLLQIHLPYHESDHVLNRRTALALRAYGTTTPMSRAEKNVKLFKAAQ
jgi:hypothetical protein